MKHYKSGIFGHHLGFNHLKAGLELVQIDSYLKAILFFPIVKWLGLTTVGAQIPNMFGIRMVGVVRFSNGDQFSKGVQNFKMAALA